LDFGALFFHAVSARCAMALGVQGAHRSDQPPRVHHIDGRGWIAVGTLERRCSEDLEA